MDQKTKLLKHLDQHTFITVEEARKQGIARMMLSRMVANEQLYRIENGIYTNDLSWLTDPLKKYTASQPCQSQER